MRTQNSRCSTTGRVYTVNRLAERLAVDRRTLKRALADTVSTKRGRFRCYTLADARAALAEHRAKTDPLESLRADLLGKRVELLDVKLAELRADVIAVSTVEAMLSEFGATIMAMLRQKLENEFPISCAGLEPAQVRVRGKALVDDIAGRLRAAVDPWRKNTK